MILQTRRKASSLSIALSLAAVLPRPSQAAEPASLIGSWKLTANYDQFTDGRRRDTWGDTPQGLLVVTANGLFAVQIMGVNRQPRPGAVPTEPVGPAIAYYGRYSVDEGTKGFSVRVEQSTFPAVDRNPERSDDRGTVVHDPARGGGADQGPPRGRIPAALGVRAHPLRCRPAMGHLRPLERRHQFGQSTKATKVECWVDEQGAVLLLFWPKLVCSRQATPSPSLAGNLSRPPPSGATSLGVTVEPANKTVLKLSQIL